MEFLNLGHLRNVFCGTNCETLLENISKYPSAKDQIHSGAWIGDDKLKTRNISTIACVGDLSRSNSDFIYDFFFL